MPIHVINSLINYQIYFMLPCMFSVIDHRWRQNVVRITKWHTRPRRSRVCYKRYCYYLILTPPWSVITKQTYDSMEIISFTWWKSKMLFMMKSSMRLPSNASWVRTNQNESVIQLIISLINLSCYSLHICIPRISNNFYKWYFYKSTFPVHTRGSFILRAIFSK